MDNIKKILSILIIISLLFSTTSCKKVMSNEPTDSSNSISSSTTSAATYTPKFKLNYLTGETNLREDFNNTRPVSIMVSNIKVALPQKGLSSADVLYEAVTEGGITRIMAVFADYKNFPMTGPVRSVRNYFISFALPHQTIFTHWGGSTYAYTKIATLKLNTLDGNYISKTAFYRDTKLASQKGQEHSNFTDSNLLQKGITLKKVDVNYSGTQSPYFNFNSEAKPAGDIAGEDISVVHSSYVTGVFSYDKEKKVYNKSEFKQPQIDANTGRQISVTNVFVLFTSMWLIKEHEKPIDMDLTKGSGYYFSNGTGVKINWVKGADNKPFKFTLENGEELSINIGKSWINLVDSAERNNCIFD